MSNKNVLKKEDKKKSKKSYNIAADAVVDNEINKLKANTSIRKSKWSELANTVTINAYD